jgi:elongation factor G
MFAAQPSFPVAYRETIRHPAEGERKYIRYFDGRGHFGHVRLQLIPHPGELCSVTVDAACPLPDESCRVARSVLFQRFDHGAAGHFPVVGFEVRLTGGSYLTRHSYPEACATAACMAYDEALARGAPFVVEPYVGVRLLVELDALNATIKRLAGLLGQVRATHTVTDIVRLEVEIPARLCDALKSSLRLRHLDTFPLAKDLHYRPLVTPSEGSSRSGDELEEWT